MHATPINGRDIALGNLAWIARPAAARRRVFTLVIVAFGAADVAADRAGDPGGGPDGGLAFAAPIAAFSATQRTPDKFDALFRFGITPLFLFSGTFYPVESLPIVLQPLAWITPLWHGVALAAACRSGPSARTRSWPRSTWPSCRASSSVGRAADDPPVSAKLVRG